MSALNMKHRTCIHPKVPARKSLGTWIPVEDEMQILSLNGELERARVAEWVATLRKEDAAPLKNEEQLGIGEMEAADRDLVVALLRQYADIVEKKEGCPPLSTTGVVHFINTGETAPIMMRRRRHAVAENAVLDKEVDEMLRNGVIGEGSGAWGFPVVLVKKKDGSVRFHVSTVDGLCVTGSYMGLLPSLPRRCNNFHAGTVARHVVELAVVLERLAEAGLSLKAAKCFFAATSMEYLGHDLTPEGIRSTSRLIKAIVEFPKLNDEAAVRRCVALAGYYRRFMPEFGSRMAPLTMLLRKTSGWTWGEKHDGAFAWAKAWLSTKPVLIYPHYRLPFKLTTDASKTGLGAVLSQDQGKGDQPVAYASKVNSPQAVTPKEVMTGAESNPIENGTDDLAFAVVRVAAPQGTTTVSLKDGSGVSTASSKKRRTELTNIRVTMQEITAKVARWKVPSRTGDERQNATYTREEEGAVIDAEIEHAADEAVRAARGSYRGQAAVVDDDRLVNLEFGRGETRIILPAVYWALAFKEAHDSIWTGHLRGSQTYERLQRTYWWPRMKEAVYNWVSACQDCGSGKAKPQVVVPPLRSVKTGDVGDRWAIDVAGPLPVTEHGNRYVVAAVEYTTRYAVAKAVPDHTAKAIARFLMQKVVLVFGPMRELMMDGAMEFGSQVTAELLELMQVKQATPVPYRPKLLGLVERFHRTWKDMISLYVNDEQDDWDDFVPCALYAYNGSKHTTHGYQPNELMMGKKLRTSAELLRRSHLRRLYQTLDAYHEVLMHDLRTAQELAALALQKEQARQAIGPGITKFGHRWRGPGQIVEAAGYDNYLVKMLESGHELVTHCSFLLPYYYPSNLLDPMARDIALDLREEAVAAADDDLVADAGSSDEDSQPQIDDAGRDTNAPPIAEAATTMKIP
ncbi:unnamed protein product [Phytophthora fragariaefolia]|uniref:Unnamed protein product n=1 Tax=Phytophthora fragariaefolia TaxID=1490495 RepID=A0A9W6WUZ9_9STRA|nr:unnamed protein product [Phytophthora fragariaefolia]